MANEDLEAQKQRAQQILAMKIPERIYGAGYNVEAQQQEIIKAQAQAQDTLAALEAERQRREQALQQQQQQQKSASDAQAAEAGRQADFQKTYEQASSGDKAALMNLKDLVGMNSQLYINASAGYQAANAPTGREELAKNTRQTAQQLGIPFNETDYTKTIAQINQVISSQQNVVGTGVHGGVLITDVNGQTSEFFPISTTQGIGYAPYGITTPTPEPSMTYAVTPTEQAFQESLPLASRNVPISSQQLMTPISTPQNVDIQQRITQAAINPFNAENIFNPLQINNQVALNTARNIQAGFTYGAEAGQSFIEKAFLEPLDFAERGVLRAAGEILILTPRRLTDFAFNPSNNAAKEDIALVSKGSKNLDLTIQEDKLLKDITGATHEQAVAAEIGTALIIGSELISGGIAGLEIFGESKYLTKYLKYFDTNFKINTALAIPEAANIITQSKNEQEVSPLIRQKSIDEAQREVKDARERVKSFDKYIEGGNFIGDEKQYAAYKEASTQFEEKNQNYKNLVERKASLGELGYEVLASSIVGASFGLGGKAAEEIGIVGAKSIGKLFGAETSSVASAVSYKLGNVAKQGINIYFTQKVIRTGGDIIVDLEKKDYNAAEIRSAGLVGGLIGYATGAKIGSYLTEEIPIKKEPTNKAGEVTNPFKTEAISIGLMKGEELANIAAYQLTGSQVARYGYYAKRYNIPLAEYFRRGFSNGEYKPSLKELSGDELLNTKFLNAVKLEIEPAKSASAITELMYVNSRGEVVGTARGTKAGMVIIQKRTREYLSSPQIAILKTGLYEGATKEGKINKASLSPTLRKALEAVQSTGIKGISVSSSENQVDFGIVRTRTFARLSKDLKSATILGAKGKRTNTSELVSSEKSLALVEGKISLEETDLFKKLEPYGSLSELEAYKGKANVIEYEIVGQKIGVVNVNLPNIRTKSLEIKRDLFEEGYPKIEIKGKSKNVETSKTGLKTLGYYSYNTDKITLAPESETKTYLHEYFHSRVAHAKDLIGNANTVKASVSELRKAGQFKYLRKLKYSSKEYVEETFARIYEQYGAIPKERREGALKDFSKQYPATAKLFKEVVEHPYYQVPEKSVIETQLRGETNLIERFNKPIDIRPRQASLIVGKTTRYLIELPTEPEPVPSIQGKRPTNEERAAKQLVLQQQNLQMKQIALRQAGAASLLKGQLRPHARVPKQIREQRQQGLDFPTIVGGGGKVVSIFAGLGLYEKTSEGYATKTLSLDNNLLTSANTRLTSKEMSNEIAKAIPREITRTIPKEITRSVPREMTREITRESLRNVPRESSREIIREALRMGLRETPRETERNVPRIAPPFSEGTNVPPLKPLLNFNKKVKNKNIPSYNVAVRRLGRERIVGIELPRGLATARGASIARTSLARTFRLIPTGKTTDIADIANVPLREFRRPVVRSKLKSNSFVQRSRFALSSPTEKRDIRLAKFAHRSFRN